MGEPEAQKKEDEVQEVQEEQEEELLEPAVEVEELGAWKRRLKVEVAADKVKEKYEKALKELSHNTQVPGFRKGRAPRKLLLNKFGEALSEDLKMKLVVMALEEALKANDFDPVSEPLFGPEPPAEAEKEEAAGEGEEGGEKEGEEAVKPPTPDEASAEYLKGLALELEEAFSFEFTVEVKPTFELPEYKGLELTRVTRPVTDERVAMSIDAVRRHEADFVPVEEGQVRPGDRLTVRASMECEGRTAWEADNEIAHATEDALLGLPGIVPYSEIEGMGLDDEKTFEVKVVDGFKEEALRGKDAKLTVGIREIKRPSLPPLDDEAARRLGAGDAESLRGEARQRLEAMARADAREGLERQITDRLVGATDFELPEGLLERTALRHEVRQILRLTQMGIAPDELGEEHRTSLRESARESSDRLLKLGLILGKIGEAEEIEVTDDDLENEIHRYALAQRRTPVSVRSELERSGRLGDLRDEMLSAKVINFIVEQADITDAQEDAAAGSPEGGAQ